MASPEWKEHLDNHQKKIKDVENKYESKAKENNVSSFESALVKPLTIRSRFFNTGDKTMLKSSENSTLLHGLADSLTTLTL